MAVAGRWFAQAGADMNDGAGVGVDYLTAALSAFDSTMTILLDTPSSSLLSLLFTTVSPY